jgi:GNAT superfamily N-acetyltransferase
MELVKSKDYYKLVDGDKMIATSFCGIVPENLVNKLSTLPMNDHNTKTLMGFFTSTEYQGKGFGKKLLQQIISSEIDAGTRYLTLGVKNDNEKAIKLYQSCGFVIEGNCANSDSYHFMYLEL